jgi:bacterioferritin-associated ferredoxin
VIVCICNRLNERSICGQRERGARDADALFASFDCEPRCGTCIPEIESLLRQDDGAPGEQAA